MELTVTKAHSRHVKNGSEPRNDVSLPCLSRLDRLDQVTRHLTDYLAPVKFVNESSDGTPEGEEGLATAVHRDFADDDWDDFGSGSEASRTVLVAEDSLFEAPATTSAIRQSSPTDRFIVHEELPESATRPRIAIQREDSEITEIRSRIYLDQPLWPLQDRQEAKLFRHFVQKLAIWASAGIMVAK